MEKEFVIRCTFIHPLKVFYCTFFYGVGNAIGTYLVLISMIEKSKYSIKKNNRVYG